MPHDGLKVAHTSEEDKKVLKEMDEWYKTKYHKYSGHARLSQGDLLDDVNPVGDLTDQVTEGVTGEEEKTEEQEELEEQAEEAAFKGLAPLFGRNLLSVLFTDLVNVFAAPHHRQLSIRVDWSPTIEKPRLLSFVVGCGLVPVGAKL